MAASTTNSCTIGNLERDGYVTVMAKEHGSWDGVWVDLFGSGSIKVKTGNSTAMTTIFGGQQS